MDTIHSFVSSPWFATVGTIASLVGLLLTVVSMLNYVQRRAVKSEYQTGEDSYLRGLIDYIHHLNIHSSFDEQFFVEREYKVREKYEARTFFMSKHQALFPRLNRIFVGTTDQQKQKSEGYFTKDLFREATSKNEPVILLGDPGSGKSVSSRQLAVSVAKRTLGNRRPNRLLPVFISLSEYTENDLIGQPEDFYCFLKSTLTRRGKSTAFPSKYLVDNLDYYLDSGRLFFILDSLDEMPPGSFSARCQALVSFMMSHGTNSFVITCRRNDFGGNIKGREAHLDKLTPKEIRAFIRKRQGLLQHWKATEVFNRIIAPSFVLNSVVDNPFYLNLILYFLSIKEILPENFPLLFRVVCDDWAEREIQKEVAKGNLCNSSHSLELPPPQTMAGDLRVALSHIAFAISSSSGFGTAIGKSEVQQLCIQYGLTVERIENAIRVAANGGMLDVSFDEAKLRFVHHKFQEYFAAEFLNDALEMKWIEYQDLPGICRNIWWEEVTALLTSITHHADKVIDVLLHDAINSSVADKTFSVLHRNFWLIGRTIHLLPNESDAKAELVDRVITTITTEIAGSRLPVVLDGLRALGEIDDQRSVEILSGYLKSSSKIFRELAFAELADLPLGQKFLVQHVYQIAHSIYFRGEYGGYGGRYAKRVRSAAFPSNYSRAVLSCYAFLSAALRAHKLLLTLAVTFFLLPVLLNNVYCIMFISLTVLLDSASLYLHRNAPKPKEIIQGLTSRAVQLALLALAVYLGVFVPPFWSALSFVGVWFVHLLVVCTIFIGPKAIRYGTKKLLIRIFNPISFRYSSAKTKLIGLKLGYIDADTYVQSNMSSTEELIKFVEKLADSDFEGLDLELFEAVQNAERRLLQKDTESNILASNKTLKFGSQGKKQESDQLFP